jgi:hypothetical protein
MHNPNRIRFSWHGHFRGTPGGQLLGFFLCFALFAIQARAQPISSPLTVSIIKPVDGQSFSFGSNIRLVAQVADQHGQVLRVDFYEDENWIASSFKSDFRALLRTPALGQHVIFAIAVDNHGIINNSAPIHISVVPSNDKFSNATVLSGTEGSMVGNNNGAAVEPGEPQHAGVGDGNSVWWRWRVPSSGNVTISPASNSYAPVVAVYTGPVVSNLTAVASSPAGAVTFNATEGTIYHIAVDGTGGWEGPFQLNLVLSTIRLTEPSQGAEFYLGAPITLAASTTAVDGNGNFVDFFADGQFVGSASRLPQATVTWTNAGLGFHSLTASTTDRRGTTRWSKPVGLTVRPLNDNFTNAFILQGLNVTTNGSNLGAGKEPGEPTGGDPSADASVWYSWTAPVSGGVTVGTGENYFGGHPLGVYVGDSVSNLVAEGESIYDFYPVGFVAQAGVTYYIEVTGFSQEIPDGAGPFTLSVVQIPAPPNDDFANAIVLTGTVVTATGSNVGATGEPGEPQESYQGIGNSVWWNWQAPTNGQLELNFQGSDFEPVVALYTGLTVSNLTLIGTVYTSLGGLTPTADFHVEAGQLYHIALVGYWYPVIAGNIVMNLSFNAAPPNDNFADSISLIGLAATSSGSNTTASAEAGEPASNGRTVWWTWTAPTTGPVSLGTSGSSFSPLLAVYTGTVLTNLVLLTNGLSDLEFNATEGVEYQISADANKGGQVGQIQLTLVSGLPANDDFINRLSLNGTNISVISSTVGATREPLEPNHGDFPGSNSIWYSWTAPAAGTATVTVTGDGFSPTWAVYTGSNLGALTDVSDSYIWPWNISSSGTFPVQAGVPFQIAVDGSVQSGGGGPAGIVYVSLSFVGLPPNDNFTNRTVISGTSIHVTGNTSGATKEPGEPDHGGYAGGHSIWWSWTAPADGQVTLDAFGSAVTTIAAVYTGSTVSDLTSVTNGDATYAPLVFACNAGVTYQIAFDHWSPDVFGAVDLNLLFSTIQLTAPTNDAVFHAPSEIVLVATNTVWDGTFTQMVFLVDGNIIGAATSVPYTFTWTNPPLGDHGLQASVTDTTGVTRVSPIVTVHLRPVNDDFADRIPIEGDNVLLHADGVNATLEPGEPSHGPVNWESVWWSWTAPSGGVVTLSKPSDSAFNYVLLDVYTGSALTNLVLVTNTPAGGSGTFTTAIDFDAVPGTTYQIVVAGSFFSQNDVPVTFSFVPGFTGNSKIQSATGTTPMSPALRQPARPSSSQFSFTFSGTPGFNYTVLASTDLSLPISDWTTVLVTNLSSGSAVITDPGANKDRCFYRVILGP